MAAVTSHGDLFGRAARTPAECGRASPRSVGSRCIFSPDPTYIRRARMSSRAVAAPRRERPPPPQQRSGSAGSLSRTLNRSNRFRIYGRSVNAPTQISSLGLGRLRKSAAVRWTRTRSPIAVYRKHASHRNAIFTMLTHILIGKQRLFCCVASCHTTYKHCINNTLCQYCTNSSKFF